MKKNIVSKSILTLACLASLGGIGLAQAAEPETTLAFNAGVVSEYRYRGISQSRFSPAVQGGVDYAHKSGAYVGAWASTIKWIKDNGNLLVDDAPNGAKGPLELDLYGGYKFPLGDVTMDVGMLRYQYVGNTLEKSLVYRNANTTEAYVAGTLDVFTLKYSYALTDLFGQYSDAGSSKGSDYLDLSATFDLGDGYSLVPHVGRQTVKNVANASYTDSSLTLNKDFGNGLAGSVTYHSTSANASYYAVPIGTGSAEGKNLGRSAFVLGLKYSF